MPGFKSSLLDLAHLSRTDLDQLFELAAQLKRNSLPAKLAGTAALLFFEMSTRTRMSFAMAAQRAGLYPLNLEMQSSSVGKGESVEDTILNVAAMGPSVLIVRCGDEVDLRRLNQEINSQEIKTPLLNAGWGKQSHPTQALLDLFTIQEELGELTNKRLLFLGDIIHSRVAASHFQLLKNYGMQIGLCGPKQWLPAVAADIQVFQKVEDALSWCDLVMALRVQQERHASTKSTEGFLSQYGLTSARLKHLKPEALIMHPGPINYGVEIQEGVSKDPRSRILTQVSNGVFVREALLRLMVGE